MLSPASSLGSSPTSKISDSPGLVLAQQLQAFENLSSV